MKISMVMPAGAAPRSGNQHTAGRWAKFLRSLGHRVAVAQQWDGAAADAMIALHARKSSRSIEEFHRSHPDRPLIVVLTGTDLYRDIGTHPAARNPWSSHRGWSCFQPAGLRELPKRLASEDARDFPVRGHQRSPSSSA